MEVMTLDVLMELQKKQFDEGLKAVEKDVANLKGPDPIQVTADISDVQQKVEDAQKSVDGIKTPTPDPLKLDTKDYVSGVEEAEEKTNTFATVASELFGGVAEKLVAAGITSMITGFVNAVGQAIDLAKNLGKEVSENAESVGLSTKAYQEWDYAMSKSGASAKSLSTGVKNINALLEGSASDKVSSAFDTLGVSLTDADGHLKTTEQLLNDTVTALANMEDGAEKTDLISSIMGNGKGLENFLSQSDAQIKQLKRDSNDLGLIMTDDQIESSLAYHDALDRMTSSIETLKQALTMDLMGPLTNVVDMMTTVMNFFNPENWRDNSAAAQFKSIEGQAQETAEGITATAAQANDLIDKLIALGPATEQTAEQHEKWVQYADWLVKNIPDLKEQIDLEKGTISGETAELKDNVKQWAARQRQMIAQQAMADEQTVLAEKLRLAAEAEVEADKKESEAVGKRAAAIEHLNSILAENEEYRNWYSATHEGKTTVDEGTSLDELSDLTDMLLNYNRGKQYDEMLGYVYDIIDLENESEAARKTADGLVSDYEEGLEKYEQYATKASEMMQGTQESTESTTGSVNELGEAIDALPENKDIYITEHISHDGDFYNGGGSGGESADGSHASGAWDIPYDNYRAVLHRNEMVLTASQARQYREGSSGGNLDMTELMNGIIGAIQSGMNGATVNAYMNGKNVSSDVDRNIVRQTKARRFAP